MKIGAYDLSNQMNMYSRLSATSVRKPDESGAIGSVNEVKKQPVNDTLSLTGGDLFKVKDQNSFNYPKFTPSNTQVSAKERLDDFSLSSAKEDTIHKRIVVPEEDVNYKEIISDEEMDNFLRKAFKLFA